VGSMASASAVGPQVYRGTLGESNVRGSNHYASASMPHGAPNPSNELLYGQAAYNEQDEFKDNTGKYKLVMKGAPLMLCAWARCVRVMSAAPCCLQRAVHSAQQLRDGVVSAVHDRTPSLHGCQDVARSYVVVHGRAQS
jgi:hypothetical protein